ncbi:hypothetical protein EB077_11075, partial [bacterium]|nr:hypothetical protein [bacterium]
MSGAQYIDTNENAIIFETQVVIKGTTSTSNSTGGLIVSGGLSSKDTYITGHVSVNDVNITPNLNDIIYEKQEILENNVHGFVDIPGFVFNNTIATAFKAHVTVNVSDAEPKTAMWELNGVYLNSGWTLTSRFTGDFTDVNFALKDTSGIGQMQYTNNNSSGITTVRYRATTNAPAGTNPLSFGGTVMLQTSGNYVPNNLVYANTKDTLATTDITYTPNKFSIGGNSTVVIDNGNTYTNVSQGGALTVMGDTSIAKSLIVG